MKNTYQLLTLALSLFLLNSCNNCLEGKGDVITKSLTLTEITSVALNGSFDLHITQGEEQTVTVTGHENIIDILNQNVNNGHWDVELDDNCISSFTLHVYVTVPNINNIELNGSGDITINELSNIESLVIGLDGSGEINSAGTISTTTSLLIPHSGSGEISLSINTPNISSILNGSGKIILNGTAPTESIVVSGSGQYRAYDLTSENTTANLNGSGEIRVYASETLHVNIDGSGTVKYKGSPSISQSIDGSGKLSNQN